MANVNLRLTDAEFAHLARLARPFESMSDTLRRVLMDASTLPKHRLRYVKNGFPATTTPAYDAPTLAYHQRRLEAVGFTVTVLDAVPPEEMPCAPRDEGSEDNPQVEIENERRDRHNERLLLETT